MVVYVCFESTGTMDGVWDKVNQVVFSEEVAKQWVEESTGWLWVSRYYDEFEVK